MAYASCANSRIIDFVYEKNDETVGFDVEFDNPEYVIENNVNDFYDFRIEDGHAVFDPEPDSQIIVLKRKLAAYDYIGIKIATGAATREDYAEQLTEAQEWRERIRELEAEIAGDAQ